jgi:GAF domain-containing protein
VELNHFTEIDINVQTTLASQIAAALRNVAQYQGAQEALAELTQLQQMVSRENWEAFMTSQTRTVQGYLFDQHTVKAIAKSDDKRVVNGKTTAVSPLTVQGVTIGGLSARNSSGEPLTDDQQELLDAVSRQISDALERARLLEVTELGRQELDKRAEQLAVINEVAQVVSQQLEESQLFTAVHEQVARAIVTDTFFVALYNANSNHFVFPYFYDLEKTHKVNPAAPAPELEMTQVWQTGQPTYVNYTPEQFWDKEAEDQKLLLTGDDGDDEAQRPSNMAFVPLMAGAKVIGVMSVQNYQFHDFTDEDISLLSGIANHVGLALENLRLFTEIQRRAERERLINEISQKIQGAQTVQGAMQAAVSELGRALKVKKAIVELN